MIRGQRYWLWRAGSTMKARSWISSCNRSGTPKQRFKSSGSAQRFLNIQSAVYSTFYVQRHLCNRLTFKRFRKDAFNVWESASAAA